MQIDNLILTLRIPAKLYLGPDGNGDGLFALDDLRARTGFPPWPSAADILVKSATREFCGVAYQVASEFRPTVRELAARLDPTCVRFIAGAAASRPAPYRDESGDLSWLQIAWSNQPADTLVLAQLGGDLWYYDAEDDRTDALHRVVGYGVGDLNELCRDFDVVLPNGFAIPTGLGVRGLHAAAPGA